VSAGSPTPDSGASRRRHLLLLCLLILVHLVSSALVISRDRYYMVPDAQDYFQWSVSIAKDLRQGEVAGAVKQLWGNRQRSPLGIVPAALSQLGGPDPVAARLSTLFWLALLLWFTYRITERLSSPGAALVAAASLGAMPMVMGFSRLLWLDMPLAAMTAWCLLMLLRADDFRSLRGALLLGLVVGLGLLTKYSLPIFVGLPALCFLLVALRRGGGERARVLRNAAASVAVAGGVFALWAGVHFNYLIKAFEMARPHLVILEKPEVGAPDPARFTYYLERIPQSSLGPVFALAMAAGFVLLLRGGRRKVLTITSAWFWGAMLLLCPFVTWDRYFLPALPAAAVVIGVGLWQVSAVARWRWAAPAAAGLLALLAVQQSWFGPVLARCGDAEGIGASARVFCSGMIRPITTLRARLDMSQLGEEGGLITLGVLPNYFQPDPAPAPYDRPPDAVRQWLLEDTGDKVEVARIADLGEVTAKTLRRFRLVAVLVPAPPFQLPPGERDVHRRARRLLAGDSGRWVKKIDVTVTDGTRLQVYRNTGEVAVPGGETWIW